MIFLERWARALLIVHAVSAAVLVAAATHHIVWLRGYFEPDTIPERQRRILADANETFGLSAISLWEVGKKHQLGSLPLDRDLEAWFHHAIAGNVDVLPLAPEIVADAMRLPAFPTRDPADKAHRGDRPDASAGPGHH